MAETKQAPETFAPHEITLFDHAQIAAEIAEADRPQAEVLASRGFTEEQWNESTIFWMTRMGDDARENGRDARIAVVYSEAFGNAQDARKPLPPMDAAEYARLVVDIQRDEGPTRPLARRALSIADYLRLSRHFARVLSSDPEQARIYFATYEALHAAG